MSFDTWTVFVDFSKDDAYVVSVGSNKLGAWDWLREGITPEGFFAPPETDCGGLRALDPSIQHVDALAVAIYGESSFGRYICGCTYRICPDPMGLASRGSIMEAVFPGDSLCWRFNFERRLRDYIASQDVIRFDRILEILKR